VVVTDNGKDFQGADIINPLRGAIRSTALEKCEEMPPRNQGPQP
jgi:hypothetical protein